MDSKEFLTELFEEFNDDTKADNIQSTYDSENWKDYQTLVHALKSTGLVIGAVSLSESAKKLEFAAKENNIEEIKANHEDLMTTYKKVREQISNWLEENLNE